MVFMHRESTAIAKIHRQLPGGHQEARALPCHANVWAGSANMAIIILISHIANWRSDNIIIINIIVVF